MIEKENKTAYFKAVCFQYLIQFSIIDLRAYGRFLNLSNPTTLKKPKLVQEIISVLCGEKNPVRNKFGAPIKNNYVKEEIILKIEEWRNRILGEEKRIQQQINNPPKNKKEGETTVRLQFSVAVEQLNPHQKQLLNDFLNSL